MSIEQYIQFHQIQIERELVSERLQENPYSLGIFGKTDRAKIEDFITYGFKSSVGMR